MCIYIHIYIVILLCSQSQPAQRIATMSCVAQTVVILVPAALMLVVNTHAQRDVSVMLGW